MEYLVFRLYGPMASWGEIAVGEARHSSSYPGKSAVCGLLGAALGIDRKEDVSHETLAAGYLQAVKVLRTGQLLKDYHTTQAPDSVGKFRYRTRRDELVQGKDRLGTVLSSREYRTDTQALVALLASDDAPYSLPELQQRLKEPVFHLYLGRKSCPLAAPMKPEIIHAQGFLEALDSYASFPLIPEKEKPEWQNEKRWLGNDAISYYYWEGTVKHFAGDADTFEAHRIQELVRHDRALSRQRWQFQQRREYQWTSSQEKLS